jgi:hypothetical protein
MNCLRINFCYSYNIILIFLYKNYFDPSLCYYMLYETVRN